MFSIHMVSEIYINSALIFTIDIFSIEMLLKNELVASRIVL